MAKTPVKKSNSLAPSSLSMGPKLIGLGVALFVLTRIIVWLPLGILGTWINGLLWPVLLVSIGVGGFLVYRKSRRS